MSRILIQIGFVKSRKISQSVKAYINDEAVTWADKSGRFLTTQKDRVWKNIIWYMYEADLEKDDVLKIDVNTFITGVGPDEDRTFESLYYVEKTAPVRSVNVSGVGNSSYPLIKGKVLEIGSVSEADKRKAEIEDFLNEGFEDEF
ncbi:MAG TPA: hypothetical protein VMX17_03405 [Candidatus Glassbacteria bacterium]|nr:hypothetical protein [Candidatus Glassbacteria bacterium]